MSSGRRLRSSRMNKHSILITGASRGMGLEWVTQAAAQTTYFDKVYCGARSLTDNLKDLIQRNSHVHFIKLDVTKDEDIQQAAQEVCKDLGAERGLNFLINNAGSLNKTPFEELDSAKMNEEFAINITGTAMMCKEFHLLLKKGHETAKRALIVNLGSIMGSMGCTRYSSFIPYQVAKAGIHMLSLSLDYRYKEHGIMVFALHPGWVQTDMGGPSANFPVEDSVRECLKLIRDPPANCRGKLVEYTGQILPW